MKLLIVSHMPHHKRDGEVVGWAPTVRELDRLATRFDTVRHVACLHPGPAPGSAIAYSAKNVTFVPVPPAGAEGFLGKLDVLRASPVYIRTILRELRTADMVHVRAPAHIALMAMVLLSALKRPLPRWFKYAGNWKPDGRESRSYAFQRWWLRHKWHRGVVTVNGQWPEQEPWIRTFFNPSLEDKDVERGHRAAAAKRMTTPLQLLFVGRVETAKGAGRAVQIVKRLADLGVEVRLELIGDGNERATFEGLAATLGVADRVSFLGWQPPVAVYAAYERAHVMVLPTSASEGWPKVLSEGMAYGVVPVAGAVSSIPQYLTELRTGAAVRSEDIDAFAKAIAGYVSNPQRWAQQSANAVAATRWYTFRHYLESVDALLAELGVKRVS